MHCPFCLAHSTATPCSHCGTALTSPDVIWFQTLDKYSYGVDLTTYRHASHFPGFFTSVIAGDRATTIAFESRFAAAMSSGGGLAAGNVLEVVYWKMFSQGGRANIQTDNVASHLASAGALPLQNAIGSFVTSRTRPNGRAIKNAIGYSADVMAVALTFPAFVNPGQFPMIDSRVATWVNQNLGRHNLRAGGAVRAFTLGPFGMRYTSLRFDDFGSYLSWVDWCNEQASILAGLQPRVGWRPRDVEMCCFVDSGLNNLPPL